MLVLLFIDEIALLGMLIRRKYFWLLPHQECSKFVVVHYRKIRYYRERYANYYK